MSEFGREAAVQGAAATPPVAVTTAAVMGGLTLQEWMAVATILYIVLQAGFLLWRWHRAWRKAQAADAEAQ